ncbi:hypothetical protein ABW20_dc0105186 [Dactylellina cionopaga]|nr:hypothetical protein ABW20_dc0105186 [Dactylellina cionopaga]
MSSQEGHLLFEGVKVPPEKEVSKTSSEAELDRSLGEILFSAWFSHEGWSKIAEITFQKTSIQLVILMRLKGLDPGGQNDVITFYNDGSEGWQNIIGAFYAVREGRAINHLQQNHKILLRDPTVQVLQFGRHSGEGNGDNYFAFVQFSDNPDWQQPTYIPTLEERLPPTDYHSTENSKFLELSLPHPASKHIETDIMMMERFFFRGLNTRLRDIELLSIIGNVRHSIAPGGGYGARDWKGVGYEYNPEKDHQLISAYDFQDHMKTANPAEDIFKELERFKLGDEMLQLSIAGSAQKVPYLMVSMRLKNQRDISSHLFAMNFNNGEIVMKKVSQALKALHDSEYLNALTDALYATWSWQSFLDLPRKQLIYKAGRIAKKKYGLRVVTFLDLRMETNMILKLIFETYRDLLSQENFMVISNPISTSDQSAYAYPGRTSDAKTVGNEFRRKCRLWITLLGLIEVAASVEIYSKYHNQMNPAIHYPGYASRLTIRRVVLPNAGEMRFEVIVSLAPIEFIKRGVKPRTWLPYLFGTDMRASSMLGESLSFCQIYMGAAERPPDKISLNLENYSVTEREKQVYPAAFAEINTKLAKIFKAPLLSAHQQKDFVVVDISHREENSSYQVLVSRTVACMILMGTPIVWDADSSTDSFYDHVNELALVYQEAWKRYSRDASGQRKKLQQISIHLLSQRTLEIIDYLFSLGTGAKAYNYPLITKFRPTILKLNFDEAYVGVFSQAVWALLMGLLEVAAIGEMLRQFPNFFYQIRIEGIIIERAVQDPKLTTILVVFEQSFIIPYALTGKESHQSR